VRPGHVGGGEPGLRKCLNGGLKIGVESSPFGQLGYVHREFEIDEAAAARHPYEEGLPVQWYQADGSVADW